MPLVDYVVLQTPTQPDWHFVSPVELPKALAANRKSSFPKGCLRASLTSRAGTRLYLATLVEVAVETPYVHDLGRDKSKGPCRVGAHNTRSGSPPLLLA